MCLELTEENTFVRHIINKCFNGWTISRTSEKQEVFHLVHDKRRNYWLDLTTNILLRILENIAAVLILLDTKQLEHRVTQKGVNCIVERGCIILGYLTLSYPIYNDVVVRRRWCLAHFLGF